MFAQHTRVPHLWFYKPFALCIEKQNLPSIHDLSVDFGCHQRYLLSPSVGKVLGAILRVLFFRT